ncbi:MAG: hypothetical protein ABSH34_26690 [Verrucomicrobiota bacterium]|jgi:hypothetical protein
MPDSGSIAFLDEILEPVARAFSREVAEALVNVKASPAAQERISELAERCNEDLLTPAERAEYESYVNAVDLISVLQAKARAWLAERGAS